MMKKMEKEMETINDIDTIIMTVYITESDCRSWIGSCGLY